MKTPLVFKLLLILVFALRLIKMNKKKPKEIFVIDFKNLKTEKLEGVGFTDLEFFKQEYRQKWTEHIRDTKEKATLYLAYKKSRYKGLYKFLWINPHLIIPFYDALKLVSYMVDKYEAVLKNINQEAFGKLINGLHVEADDFILSGEVNNAAFEEFDRYFDMNYFLQRVKSYVAK